MGLFGEVLDEHLLLILSVIGSRGICWTILTVATVMMKAAELEQAWISLSTWIIFLTRETGKCEQASRWNEKAWGHTGELSSAGGLLPGRDGSCVVRHGEIASRKTMSSFERT